jgi:hypothetical protein
MPRSGSTYNSLEHRSCPRPRRGKIWGRSRAEGMGERLTAIARLLSVTRRPRTPRTGSQSRSPHSPFAGDTRPSERQVASLAGKGAGHVFSVRRRTPPSSSAVKEPEARRRRRSFR